SHHAINGWLRQRNFRAALITAPVFIVSALGIIYAAVDLYFYSPYFHPSGNVLVFNEEYPNVLLLPTLASSILYLWWRFRRARWGNSPSLPALKQKRVR